MVRLVSGDPYEGDCSQDKQREEGERWYYSRKEIEENSPSKRDGIDPKKEADLRKSYCIFLQDLGKRLDIPQITIATAIVFCHRFYLCQSHAKNDRRIIATACMFLAGKVEETPRPLREVIQKSYEIINNKDPKAAQKIKQKEVYDQQKELILLGERIVLTTLGFDVNVQHPYKPLVVAIKQFKVAQNSLAQVAWNFINDGLRTSLCLQFKPHHIAAGAIFLAAKFLKVKLPSDAKRVWWQELDITPRQLEEVSSQMLELYEQVSDVQGSSGSMTVNPPSKAPKNREHAVPARFETSKESFFKHHQFSADNHAASESNEHGSSEMESALINISYSGSVNDQQPEPETSHQKGEAESKMRPGSTGFVEISTGKSEDLGELNDKHIEQSDQSSSELEDGVELAAESEKYNGVKRQSWSLPERQEFKNLHHRKPHEDAGDEESEEMKGQSSFKPDTDNVEEGGLSIPDDAGHHYQSPEFSKPYSKGQSSA
ncbi:hypothetical protein SLA2020_525150 [Shorea laevis]